ncbi:uncharacterized protein LOC127265009 [Andrographis paniculata]|uniref:uncharacterized protein LOC127265009 n=1 Tax=Andrographis paniculata TaxID=175694 RepID=UPI0021E739AC|nr:uncharacterized protein LOC127265009 [Andrographis paniculata]
MECWIPLFDIFLNSPCPETEASTWLQKSFNSSSSSTSTSTASFLALLTKYSGTTHISPSSPSQGKRVMWIQTLPDMVQARILSFLAYDHQKFSKKDLCKLARIMLSEGSGLDFWVKKAAKHLLDLVSVSNYEWISHLTLDSEEDELENFHSPPDWLRTAAKHTEAMFPWLPMSLDEMNSKIVSGVSGHDEDNLSDNVETGAQEHCDEVMDEIDVDESKSVDKIDAEVENRAKILKAKVAKCYLTSEVVELVKEIHELCFANRRNSLEVLSLIEPWNVDDETASSLLFHFMDVNEGNEVDLSSYSLCSFVLPKFLALEEPCSRVLMIATIEYCKAHQRAAEYALLFPLMLRNKGINNPLCELITKILKECFHPAHVSAFFQKFLSKDKDGKRVICLPCHQNLIGNEIVWTESLFCLVQNILNHNVQLTQDSVDQLVDCVCEFSIRYSSSLKFGNFLLCLVNKCTSLLKPHKLSLTAAVESTNTLVKKSVLSKLSTL